MELTDKMTFWRRIASRIATDKLTEVKVALTKIRATVSLLKISKNEIEKNEEEVLLIYGIEGRGRRSDALVRSKANKNMPPVQSIKCTAARGDPCK